MSSHPAILFVDPTFSATENDLFSFLEKEAIKQSFIVEQDFSLFKAKVKDTSLEASFYEVQAALILDYNQSQYIELLDDEAVITSIVKGANLNMFENLESVDEKNIYIEDQEDIRDFFLYLQRIYRLRLIEKESILDIHGKKYLKKIFLKENIFSLRDDEKLQSAVKDFEMGLHSFSDVLEARSWFSQKSKDFFGVSSELVRLSEISTKEALRSPYLEVFDQKKVGKIYLRCDDIEKLKENLLLYVIADIYFRKFDHRFNELNFEDWEEVFTLFPIPIVVLGGEGELFLHNKEFLSLKMSVKNCLELENNEQVTIDQKVFRVTRTKRGDSLEQFVFLPAFSFLDGEEEGRSEELGIVSSSIAHELNNPLAGALAALDVLGLDEFEQEITEKISDMRKGVFRCKKLVETFLGFSRLPTEVEARVSGIPTTLVSDSIKQAIELVRFRLIENNIALSFEEKVVLPFGGGSNPHILSMIFYLVFNEFITLISHHKLVVGSNSKDQISFLVSQNFDILTIEVLNVEISLGKEFLESKLLQHLLSLEKIRIDSNSEKLIFLIL